MRPHACGKFFYKTPHVYHAGSVCGMAACLRSRSVAEYLLNAQMHKAEPKARLTALRDAGPSRFWHSEEHKGSADGQLHRIAESLRGNSVLHAVVTHNNIEILETLVRYYGADLTIRNELGLDVLAWSCLIGSPKMVSTILHMSRTILWQWGPIDCVRYDVDALLRACYIAVMQQRAPLITLRHFAHLLDDMWHSFASRTFYTLFSLHFVFMTICSLLVVAPRMPIAHVDEAISTYLDVRINYTGHGAWVLLPWTLWVTYMDVIRAPFALRPMGRWPASSVITPGVASFGFSALVWAALLTYYLQTKGQGLPGGYDGTDGMPGSCGLLCGGCGGCGGCSG